MATQLQYGMGGERPYELYYKHSGQTPVASILLAGLAGIAAGIVAAVIYAYAIEYIPFIKLRFLLTVGFGAVVGGVTAMIAKAGKVRSTAVVLAMVGVCTLVAFYFAWVFWVKAVVDRYGGGELHVSLSTLITSPNELLDWVKGLNESGTWSMSKSDKENVKGGFLTVIWLIEFGSILGFALITGASLARADIFCEKCNRWCGKATTARTLGAGDVNKARSTLEAHDWTYLSSLGPPNENHFWQANVESCPNCGELHALTIKETKVTRDKKGKITANANKTIINKLLITAAESAAIRAAAPAAGPPPLPGQG